MRRDDMSRGQWEQALIASLMLEPAQVHDLPPGFTPGLLVNREARAVAEALSRIVARGEQPDLATLHAESGVPVEAIDHLDSEGSRIPTRASFAAKQVLEISRSKALAGDVYDLWKRLDGGAPRAEVLRELAERVEAEGAQVDDAPDFRAAEDVALGLFDQMEQSKFSGKAAYMRTGFPSLDRMGRWFYGSTPVIAARPGVGKTTLIDNIVALSGEKALVHSLEMPAEQQIAKMASHLSRHHRVVGGVVGITVDEILDEEKRGKPWWETAKVAMERASSVPVVFNDTHAGLQDILRISRKAIRQDGVRLVVVDYIQLVEWSRKGANREQEVGRVSRSLRRLAIEETARGNPCVVVMVSQLNRPLKGQEHKPPQLTDLRESGQIEQDATHVWMLHDLDTVPRPSDPEARREWVKRQGHVVVLPRKQRLSGTGSAVLLQKQLNYSRFVEAQLTEKEEAA